MQTSAGPECKSRRPGPGYRGLPRTSQRPTSGQSATGYRPRHEFRIGTEYAGLQQECHLSCRRRDVRHRSGRRITVGLRTAKRRRSLAVGTHGPADRQRVSRDRAHPSVARTGSHARPERHQVGRADPDLRCPHAARLAADGHPPEGHAGDRRPDVPALGFPRVGRSCSDAHPGGRQAPSRHPHRIYDRHALANRAAAARLYLRVS